jgi:hypothetical protein
LAVTNPPMPPSSSRGSSRHGEDRVLSQLFDEQVVRFLVVHEFYCVGMRPAWDMLLPMLATIRRNAFNLRDQHMHGRSIVLVEPNHDALKEEECDVVE